MTLALPIAAQNLVSSTVNMVDTVMIGQLGEVEIAAVGQANQLFFLFALMLFGINSGSAIFTAQFWGIRDIKNIRRVLGLNLLTACGAGVLFTVLALLFPEMVMRVYSKDPAVIEAGVRYLKIVGWSYIPTAVSFAYASVLRSTEQPRIPMTMSIVSLLTNAVLNYVLIFGKFGFPEMGIDGAALATLIARILETGLMLLIVYAGKHTPAARISEMLDLSRDFVVRFFRTSVPVILNETIWSLGVSIYSVIYGRIGTSAVAAVNISGTVTNLAMVLFQGMANAAAIMIGNRIGAGDEDKAFVYSERLLTLGPLAGVAMGVILMLTGNFFVSFYSVTEEVSMYAVKILIVFGSLMPFKIFNMINIVGVLRSGGDTKFSLFLDTVGVWFISIPLAILSGLVLRFPVHWVYLLVGLEEVFKLALGLYRFRSKKWINNLVKDANHEETECQPVLSPLPVGDESV